MSDRNATEPRTEAGRDALSFLKTDEWRKSILAIEAEAAQGAAPLDSSDVIDHDHVREQRYVSDCEDCRHNLTTPLGYCLPHRTSEGAAPLDEPCKVCEGWGAYCDEHRPERAAPRAEGLDVGLLTTAIHTADPTYGPDGIGHNPMCEKRAEKIAAAYLREQRLRSRSSDEIDTARANCSRFRHDEHCDHG